MIYFAEEEMTELARAATATDVCDDIKEHDEERIAVARAFLEKLR